MTAGSRTDELRKTIARDPRRRAHVDAVKQELYDSLALSELRRRFSMTQEQVAMLMGVTQESVSQIERRDEVLLSTLLKYVNALGGTLEVNAVIKGEKVTIQLPSGDREGPSIKPLG